MDPRRRKGKRESLASPALRGLIRELNALDVELYAEAERLLDQQLAAVRRLKKHEGTGGGAERTGVASRVEGGAPTV